MLIFFERFSIDVVSGACRFLQSRMFLQISSCWPFVVSSQECLYPHFLFVVAAALAPARSKKLLYICWYTLTCLGLVHVSKKDLVSFSTLVLYFSRLADGTSLSSKFFTLSDCGSTKFQDFVVIGQWTVPWLATLSLRSMYVYTRSVSEPLCVSRYPMH